MSNSNWLLCEDKCDKYLKIIKDVKSSSGATTTHFKGDKYRIIETNNDNEIYTIVYMERPLTIMDIPMNADYYKLI